VLSSRLCIWTVLIKQVGMEDHFPFGKAPFIILVLTLVSGGWLLVNPVEKKESTLQFWTFARTHAMAYKQAVPSFEKKHPGVTVDVQLVHGTAVTSRLRAAFWADLDVPDLVEVEIGSAGTFFRGPHEEIGFVDLTPLLEKTGLIDRIVKSRFAPYTSKGRIYGLPHDVHPVMLAYRRDLFEKHGIDVSELTTWDKFVKAGRKVTALGERYMIQLSDASAAYMETFLFQRGGGYFDQDGKLIIDNEIAIETVKWYIPLVAGPKRISSDPGWGQPFAQAFEDGYILSAICPDWRSKSIEKDITRLSGKMALMKLPAFEPGGRRTSTWGGTMVGITKHCKDKELAFKLARHLYLDTEELAKNFREINILPPLKDAWQHEAFNEPREYWSGQPLGKLYTELAPSVPAQYTHPYIQLAKSKLGGVVSTCAAYYRRNGDEGFDAFVRRRLKEAAREIRKFSNRNPF